MNSAAARIGGLVVGLFIIILGFSLLTQEAGLDGSARTKALVYALTALGIGVTAAALLPNTLTVGGEQIKPLGASFQATGGAAFFVATLIFLFYTEDTHPAQGREDQAEVEREQQADGTEDGEGDTPPTPAANEPTPFAQPGAGAAEPQQMLQAQQSAGLQPGFIANPYGPAPANPTRITRVRTYCSDCCPAGPSGCVQVGGAQSYDVDEAEIGAYAMCVENGGLEATCLINLEHF